MTPALARELDAMGVRIPQSARRCAPTRIETRDPWWLRGEECPH